LDIETAWVKPPPQVGGLDHLAVQAPCINIYSRLLPGITNVTDRARYYSFYPWLIWAFDKRGFTRYDDEFIERFRRADCLFSLIAERHAALSENAHEDHAAAMVGSNTLSPIARNLSGGKPLKLSDYSLREGAKTRYFMNKMGGLGQYYLGVLRELSILDGDTLNGVKYTRQIGQVIAEHTDVGFDSDLFLSVVDTDFVTAEQLDTLSDLCPCQLSRNLEETKLLSEIFFVRGLFHNVEALPRRRSLQLLLQLAGLMTDKEYDLSEFTFRACMYSSALPSGESWSAPNALLGVRRKWCAYARNEILSIAVQGLFFAMLDAYEESGLRLGDSSQVVEWFAGQPEALDAVGEFGAEKSLSECVVASDSWLPLITQWTQPNHEVQLTEDIASLSRSARSAEHRREIVIASLRTLIALARRTDDQDNPYGELVFDEGFFRYYPINLESFNAHGSKIWAALTMRDFLRWVLLNWGIELHLRVALRKLRGQSQSTFRIRPSDRGLEVIAVPPAVHTRPRFNQAMRILKDIGALKKDELGKWMPSEMGKSMLDLGDAP
jgi:hypothetical protein